MAVDEEMSEWTMCRSAQCGQLPQCSRHDGNTLHPIAELLLCIDRTTVRETTAQRSCSLHRGRQRHIPAAAQSRLFAAAA